MSDLFNRPISIKCKQGVSANINATATLAQAVKGELHYATDTDKLYIYNGTAMTLINGVYTDGTDTIIDTKLFENPSDLIIDCGTEKTIELTEVVYDDLQVNIGAIAGRSWFGPSFSEIVEYRSGDAIAMENSMIDGYKFKFNAQIKHQYALGEDIYFHLHIGNNSTTSGDVVLKLTYEWANVNGTYGGTTSETKTFSVSGTNGSHQVFEFSTALVGAGKTISSILLANVERLAGDSADTFSESLYVIGVDYHVPHNTMGSRQEWVK